MTLDRFDLGRYYPTYGTVEYAQATWCAIGLGTKLVRRRPINELVWDTWLLERRRMRYYLNEMLPTKLTVKTRHVTLRHYEAWTPVARLEALEECARRD